jgi:hypothetical protein
VYVLNKLLCSEPTSLSLHLSSSLLSFFLSFFLSFLSVCLFFFSCRSGRVELGGPRTPGRGAGAAYLYLHGRPAEPSHVFLVLFSPSFSPFFLVSVSALFSSPFSSHLCGCSYYSSAPGMQQSCNTFETVRRNVAGLFRSSLGPLVIQPTLPSLCSFIPWLQRATRSMVRLCSSGCHNNRARREALSRALWCKIDFDVLLFFAISIISA